MKHIILFAGCLTLVLLAVGLTVIYFAPPPPKPSPKIPDLKVEVQVKSGELIITNNDNFTYPRAQAALNPGWNSYGANLGDIPAGKSKRVHVLNFATLSNERFNPFTTKISSFLFETCINGTKVTYINEDRMPDAPCQ
jgi:hypothetical protein